MGQNSEIEWTHHTFNPWVGCTKVSAGCAHCYAEALMDTRYGKAKWGPSGTRVVKKDWSEPRKWDRLAAAAGERHRVFCASLADIFEGEDTMPAASLPAVRAARVRLFDLIRQTPNLDWLLLTKRPENVRNVIEETLIMAEGGDVDDKDYFVKYGESDPETELGAWLNNWTGDEPPANVWLGTSVENQATADERIPHLLKVPAAVRFLSSEPLLRPIDLDPLGIGSEWTKNLHWVIVGGESGPGARPCDVAWVRSLVSQCKAAGVAPFVKQLGARIITRNDDFLVSDFTEGGWQLHPDQVVVNLDGTIDGYQGAPVRIRLKDRKGGDMSEWPEDLRVREMPRVEVGSR